MSAEERYWRQVPKVNVLQTQRSIPQKDLLFRGLLALVVLVGVYLIYSQWSTKSDVDDNIAAMTVNLQRSQGSLDQQRQGVSDLHAQINELNARREAINQAIQIVTSNSIDWFSALDSLFLAQSSEVIFETVSAETISAGLHVGGLARGEGSKSTLPTQFSSISDSLDFQSILWAEGSDPPVFTATFRVSQ